MAKLDIYELADGMLVLDCQADLLSALNTRVVAPLTPTEQGAKPLSRLNPLFDVGGRRFIMDTQFIASVPVRELGSPIGSLNDCDAEVSNALDMLFIGY